MEIEEVAKHVVDAAIKVHRALGPGLLESAYQHCLTYELRKRGMRVDCEVLLPIVYDGQKIDAGYRIDMLVEGKIIVENKTVKTRSTQGISNHIRTFSFFIFSDFFLLGGLRALAVRN